MATRMTRTPQGLLLAAVVLFAMGGCTSLDRPSVQADEVALPTPLRSYDASVAATLGQLQAAVSGAGSRLVAPSGPYRPSEPPSLLQTPRVVMRADLADPADGFVVIYDTADARTAQERAGDLADYLASGFGQSNFGADTQFSVAVVGDTVIFTSWSRSRSSDPERTEAVFDAVASVGQPVDVLK